MSSLHSRITNRTFYEGAKQTKVNKDFYNGGDVDFETLASPDRRVLKARARWLSANNNFMFNADNAILDNVIGRGIKLKMQTGKKKYDEDVEYLWNKWTKNCDLTGRHTFNVLQRVILKSRMVDGEILIYLTIRDRQLKLHLIESENLDTNLNKAPNGNKVVEGIEIGSFGEVIAYHILDSDNKTFRLDADEVINFYNPVRSTQYRGVSEYAPCIIDIKNYSAFVTASIQSARGRANISYIVKQDGKPRNLGGDVDGKVQSINGVSVQYLRKGEAIEKLDPDTAGSSDFHSFSETIIRNISVGRGISYEVVSNDYTRTNYASSRASLLQDYKRFDYEQDLMVDKILDVVFEKWLEVERLAGRVKTIKDGDKHSWQTEKRDFIDPLKDATTLEKLIDLNLTTETAEAEARGKDYEDILMQKRKEMEMRAEYGIPERTVDSTTTNDTGKVNFDNNITGAEGSSKKGN